MQLHPLRKDYLHSSPPPDLPPNNWPLEIQKAIYDILNDEVSIRRSARTCEKNVKSVKLVTDALDRFRKVNSDDQIKINADVQTIAVSQIDSAQAVKYSEHAGIEAVVAANKGNLAGIVAAAATVKSYKEIADNALKQSDKAADDILKIGSSYE